MHRNSDMILLRSERPEDEEAIRRVNKAAFAQEGEADLVDALRQNGKLLVSLVAEEAGHVVEHIAFTRVTIQTEQEEVVAVGLAPVAVLPDRQRCGIGGMLVQAGLEACRELGHDLVFLVGHPAYYPRFGFVSAEPLGLRWEHEVPADVFMV